MKSTIIWPEIFLTGIEPEETRNHSARKWLLCANGLEGWGLCLSGNIPPENFGKGMAAISTVVGVATASKLEEWSKNNPIPEELTHKTN